MKWNKKHERYLINEEIKRQQRRKWRAEFDRAIWFIFFTIVGLGAVICTFIYNLANK
mgnify:CR=1 FL=1